MTTCDELREYLAAYADGELAGDLCEKVRAHLASCDACRRECADLAKVVSLYRSTPPVELTGVDWTRVSSALEACLDASPVRMGTLRARGAGRLGWLRWMLPVAAAAAVLVALALNWNALLGPASTGQGGGELPPVVKAVPEHPAAAMASVDGLEVSPDYISVVQLPEETDGLLAVDFYGPE